MVIGVVAGFELAVGDTATLEASGYFRDPDGDALSFEARSSAGEVAGTEVSGSTIRIVALAPGASTVAITARDPEGRAAALRFEVTVPNRAPVATGAIPDLQLTAADTTRVDLSGYFADPDGEVLIYGVASSDSGVVTVTARGDTMRVVGVAPGMATVTIAARDPGGLGAELSFAVEVRPARRFDIEVRFDTTAAAPRRAVVLEAAELLGSGIENGCHWLLPSGIVMFDSCRCWWAPNTSLQSGSEEGMSFTMVTLKAIGPSRK